MSPYPPLTRPARCSPRLRAPAVGHVLGNGVLKGMMALQADLTLRELGKHVLVLLVVAEWLFRASVSSVVSRRLQPECVSTERSSLAFWPLQKLLFLPSVSSCFLSGFLLLGSGMFSGPSAHDVNEVVGACSPIWTQSNVQGWGLLRASSAILSLGLRVGVRGHRSITCHDIETKQTWHRSDDQTISVSHTPR